MTRLHVIQTIASIAEHTGGPARTIRSLCEALARQGAAVTLLAGDDPGTEQALLVPDPALVETRLTNARRSFASLDLGDTSSSPVTLLHDNGLWLPGNLAAARAARRRRIPYVVSPHGMLDPWALARHPVRKSMAWIAYQRRALAQAAGLIASSEYERTCIRARVSDRPIALIPNGVDVPATLDSAPRCDARRTLLFLSRLHPVKNIENLVLAWARIAADPRFDAWHLQIAGPDEGGYRAEIAGLITSFGLAQRVQLTGSVAEADKAAVFAAAELFILPSHMESFGVAAAEALAHGLPVIASTGTPWTELETLGCGWRCGTAAGDLADVLGRALLQPRTALEAMGRKGRAYVAGSFNWDRIAAQTMAFYGWLTAGGTVPDTVDV